MVSDGKSPADRLRALVKDAADKNILSTASFFAEKLLCMPDRHPNDVYSMGQLYYQQRMYRRALLTLEQVQDWPDLRFRLLAAQCLLECKEFDQCLSVLEGAADQMDLDVVTKECGVDTVAAMWLIKGKVYDLQQNRVKAAQWYQESVKRDVHCFEGFEKLIDNHMLTAQQERELLASLEFSEEDAWLRVFYQSRVKKYDLVVDHPVQEQALALFPYLADSLDLMTMTAEFYYYHNDFARCHEQTKAILQRDPYAHACLPVHLSSLVELHLKRELFIDAHKLVDEHAECAPAWYAVGCYYYLTNKFEQARRYFQKATSINAYFAPAWLGYGHTFAAQDESDQVHPYSYIHYLDVQVTLFKNHSTCMSNTESGVNGIDFISTVEMALTLSAQALAAYRTASRFFCGCHLPTLCIGMEYAKTGNLQIAEQFFGHATGICSFDPLAFNEIGVVRYLQQDYGEAARAFEKVIDLCGGNVTATWEATLFNLGHCYRKQSRFDDAIAAYKKALHCCPRNASTYTAIGFAYHLKGQHDVAIDYYHKALGLNAQDALTTEMLERALKDAAISFSGHLLYP